MQEALLEEELGFKSTAATWDQFAENERKFGITLDGYNESEYTVKLDTNAPDFEQRQRRAEVLAQEIRNGRAGGSTIKPREGLDSHVYGMRQVKEETGIGRPLQEENDGILDDETGNAVSNSDENLGEGPAEEWPLQDAPEYEPSPGGLAALPEEAKALLPLIAEHCALSLRRILEDSGLVPRQPIENDEAGNVGTVASVDSPRAELVSDPWWSEEGLAVETKRDMGAEESGLIGQCTSVTGDTARAINQRKRIALKGAGRGCVGIGYKVDRSILGRVRSPESSFGSTDASDKSQRRPLAVFNRPPAPPPVPAAPSKPSWASIVKSTPTTNHDEPRKIGDHAG